MRHFCIHGFYHFYSGVLHYHKYRHMITGHKSLPLPILLIWSNGKYWTVSVPGWSFVNKFQHLVEEWNWLLWSCLKNTRTSFSSHDIFVWWSTPYSDPTKALLDMKIWWLKLSYFQAPRRSSISKVCDIKYMNLQPHIIHRIHSTLKERSSKLAGTMLGLTHRSNEKKFKMVGIYSQDHQCVTYFF